MPSKKGVSEMVSYVLLVVIAVGLSVLVYNYLSVYTPKDLPQCEEDVRIILQSYSCYSGTPGTLNLTLLNKGVFKIDVAYIRFGAESRKVKTLINENDLYFSDILTGGKTGLNPGKTATKGFVFDITSAGRYAVEIQPAVFTDTNELALCESAVITQPIDCT